MSRTGSTSARPLEKIERLGCLYLTFLNNPGGLSFQQIKEFLPLAYQGDQETSRRKFERDKEELKQLGLALRHFAPGETLPTGAVTAEHRYVPGEEIQKLPELKLQPGEASELAAVLFAAMEENQGRDRDLVENIQSAAVKLLYRHPVHAAATGVAPAEGEEGAGPGTVAAGSDRPLISPDLLETGEDPVAARLGLIMDALHRRRVLSLVYPSRGGESVERAIEGRGLLTHRGRWCLVAYCRRVEAIRSFYLDRIRSVEVLEANFRPDPDFQIKNYSLHPLAIRLHPTERLRLELDEEREEVFRDFLIGLPAFLSANSDADGVRELATSNRNALYSWMIRNPGVIRALGPPAALRGFRDYLAAMEEPYRSLYGTAEVPQAAPDSTE